MAKEAIKEKPDEVDQYLLQFFNRNGGINYHAVERAKRHDGLSFLFTNAKLSLSEAIQVTLQKT